MNSKARITSKGQVTIPIKVRRELGVKPGDTIVFETDEHEKMFVRPERKESPFAKYRGIGTPGIGPGREAVIRAIRELRGFDPDDPTIE